LKDDTTELEFFLKIPEKEGESILQHKKSSRSRTEGAPEQSRYNKKSSTSRTGRAPARKQERRVEPVTHLLLQFYYYVIICFMIVEEGVIY